MYFQTKDKSECCACTACVNACPQSCIHMVQDEEGFSYPKIDETSCINCHLCEKVCPMEHPDYSNSHTPNAFAVLLKDVEQRKQSSSGGAFYAIATFVLKNDGVVIGATMDENLQVRHVAIDSRDELFRLRGSKYVQSSLDGVFSIVKEVLVDGKWCYFVGTGCQVAGLKAFLRKPYDRLITSDLVCHGVPSQKLFDMHISYLEEKYKDKVIDYQFRNNSLWGVCEICDFANHKTIMNPSYELSPYLYSFMYAMTYRYSCYDCKFACIPRQGDITLADYWGVKELFPQIDITHGVSLVLVNTGQGEKVWMEVKESYEFYESTVEDGARYNGNLVKKSEKPALRDGIYERINELGYKKVAETTFKSPRIWIIKLFNAVNNSFIFKPFLALYRKMK